ncbi:uncharacterized protein EV154DRAFT_599478 [Mucor mucedo]|uniref:uncharacterized protein n=1 Tax=Mucor mucedo TaxID=29922 RepID=UPI0022208F9E|nr:uncharacterized protein EV154DRAFT_599478 [Mucor mucedo]KAI7895276.1 hypothetical protein EV154DRAFT_599478 [Mucor mucedo]
MLPSIHTLLDYFRIKGLLIKTSNASFMNATLQAIMNNTLVLKPDNTTAVKRLNDVSVIFNEVCKGKMMVRELAKIFAGMNTRQRVYTPPRILAAKHNSRFNLNAFFKQTESVKGNNHPGTEAHLPTAPPPTFDRTMDTRNIQSDDAADLFRFILDSIQEAVVDDDQTLEPFKSPYIANEAIPVDYVNVNVIVDDVVGDFPMDFFTGHDMPKMEPIVCFTPTYLYTGTFTQRTSIAPRAGGDDESRLHNLHMPGRVDYCIAYIQDHQNRQWWVFDDHSVKPV